MKIHERTIPVQKAGFEIRGALGKLYIKHGLTFGEIFSILSTELSDLSKQVIRGERHPENTDIPGDQA